MRSSAKKVLSHVLSGIDAARRWLLEQQWFNATVLPAIPRPGRWLLRKIYFLPADLLERLAGLKQDMVPPRSMNFTGSVGDFKASGEALVTRLVDYGCLTPDSRVLDIGCGMGRLAVALTSYLGPRGSYEGIDIVPDAVTWCRDNISAQHPHFSFTLADIQNGEYQPRGRIKAADYRFPYADGSFDLVVLTSVFTHMMTDEVEHYVAEISRMLKPGGRCYSTYSLLDDESLKSMEAGRSSLRFERLSGPCWVVDHKVPELAVAYDSSFVHEVHERHGLSSEYVVHHGGWSRRPSLGGVDPGFSQDVVLAMKAA
jgi:SAM-dependent methyltransferase